MAIRGIGIDLCSISRMEKAVARQGFVDRVFSGAEIAYAETHTDSAKHFASAFASREALAKAGGWGLGALGLKACSVERTENGPKFVFDPAFAERLKEENVTNVHLSISHEGDFAVAMVVLEIK